ncbi:MAG: glycosyltransferase [Syntrophobacteraceae bacterium]|jgi:glycosyltransferase involved in cell wall biosynthesis
MAQSHGLSVCMIVKNESANIADALACFDPFAEEIIVVDTGSRDNTKEIAARFTSKIYDFEWIDDFAAARNFAISKAVRSYQLWVDADDRITPENQGHIESLKSHFDGKKAFYFILENHQTDAPPSSCRQLRCTPITGEVLFEGRIHEQIFPSAVRAGLEMVTTDIVVSHLGYMTEQDRRAKAKRNLVIMERERAEGRDDGGLHFFLAMVYAHIDRRQEAIRSMLEALERFEKENYKHHLIPEGYLFLAKVSFEMEEHASCVRYLAMAGSLVNGNPLHNFNLGILYQRLGRHLEALKAFKEVSGKKYAPNLFPAQPLPNHSELLLHMAYSFFCMNDHQSALKLINASGTQGSQFGKSWEWLGTKAFMFQNSALAQIGFETALRFGALEPVSWGRLGAIYKQRGFSEKAQECLLRAEGLNV